MILISGNDRIWAGVYLDLTWFRFKPGENGPLTEHVHRFDSGNLPHHLPTLWAAGRGPAAATERICGESDCWEAKGSAARGLYLLHQLHDLLKHALLIRGPLLPLKVLTDVPHDSGLLFVALVVLWAQARLVSIQPLWVLGGRQLAQTPQHQPTQRNQQPTLVVISFRDGYRTSLESRFCMMDCMMGRMFPSSPPSPPSSKPRPSRALTRSSPASPVDWNTFVLVLENKKYSVCVGFCDNGAISETSGAAGSHGQIVCLSVSVSKQAPRKCSEGRDGPNAGIRSWSNWERKEWEICRNHQLIFE